MKRLNNTFQRRGSTHKLIFKSDLVVIYEVLKKYVDGYTPHWFEVFKYKVHQPDKFTDEEYEMYPTDESFGKWAWCCSNKQCVDKVLKSHFPGINYEKILKML